MFVRDFEKKKKKPKKIADVLAGAPVRGDAIL